MQRDERRLARRRLIARVALALRACIYLGVLVVAIVGFAPRIGVFALSLVNPMDAGFRNAGSLGFKEIDEASGLVGSYASSDTYWFVNDDGPARLYAQTAAGKRVGTVRLVGASNRDWESLARFRWRGEPWLLVADVGDNLARHRTLRLYVFREPTPATLKSVRREVLLTPRTVRVVLDGGPRDIEAVTVDSQRAQLLMISKRDEIPAIFSLSLARIMSLPDSHSEVHVAHKVGTLNLPIPKSLVPDWLDFKRLVHGFGPTGIDISPDGRQAAVLEHRALWMYSRASGESWVDALSGMPLAFGEHGLRQAETVSFDHTGQHVLVSSEGRDASILMKPVDPLPDTTE